MKNKSYFWKEKFFMKNIIKGLKENKGLLKKVLIGVGATAGLAVVAGLVTRKKQPEEEVLEGEPVNDVSEENETPAEEV
jgi:hypothetical protein